VSHPIDRDDDEKLPSFARADVSTPLVLFAVIAALCLTLGIVVVGLGGRDTSTSAGLGAPLTAHVGLSEFAIEPASFEVASGGVLHVQNEGAAIHNLAVVDTDLKTPDLTTGEAFELDVSPLAAGSYQLVCLISGHADAGMKAELEVKDEGGASAAAATPTPPGHSGHTSAEWAQMTADMLETMGAFPAETAGVGNEPLAPTEVREDGTKVFDLDMRVADWEVEPGKVVDAFTFNGMVPGPRIDLEVGDTVDVRLRNDLEVATDLHLHGLNVENRFDGVAPITQDLIEPGETFTYSFVADEVAVAMYHPHAHGHTLLPDGMFGVILVGDVDLHRGQTIGGKAIPADLQVSQEIPMVLNDAGVIGYSLNGKSFPATAPIAARVGDWILVHYFNEGTQIHPMHLHQFDQIVVAKDGFALDQPYLADTLNVAPGERYSVLVQLDKPGTWVWHCHILPHVEREAGMFGMVTALVVT
jgi:FtsP/CotA-like multicopper oxidase with cupredoxin domain